MKKIKQLPALLAALLATAALQAQTVGAWKTYKAYNDASIVVKTPNAIYAVCDGSLLSYSPNDRSIQTYSIQDGLSSSPIQSLNYCPDTKALLVVYNDANIDLFYGRNQVCHLPDIKNKGSIANKIINSVDIRNGYAYLATGFGIVTIDMRRQEFKGTYGPETNIMATCEWEDCLYAATEIGMVRAALSGNLIDKSNWIRVNELDNIRIQKMVVFNDHLVMYDESSLTIWYYSHDKVLKELVVNNICRQLTVVNNQLAIIYWNMVGFYKDFHTISGVSFTDQIRGIVPSDADNRYWLAWGDQGLVEVGLKPIADNWSEYEILTSNLKIDGPLRNQVFRLKFSGDKLMVTGGDRYANRKNLPGVFMVYENGHWKNLDHNAISAQTGVICQDLLDAVEDPRTPGRYFVSSWGEGVYVLNSNLELETLYTTTNSSLPSIYPNDWKEPNYVRVDGMVFDAQHNLYIVSAGVSNGLTILSANGKWSTHRYDRLSGVAANRILLTRDGKKWFNFFRSGESAPIGIFVLDDTRGSVDDTGDDSQDLTYYSNQFADQQGRNIEASAYNCIEEDLAGIVWVGTDNGIITFSSAEQVERGECNRPVGVDAYGEGYYPLEGQKITSIAIDGGNRKWIGTDGGGLFLFDNTNELTITNFNTKNSPLLSDNITSVAINGKTGEIFIGTNLGICSYQGDAIDGKADFSQVYAFPNPVFPLRSNQVVITGLMQNSRVKITDLAGNRMQEANSNGGQYTWNCTNARGEIVSAGIYLVFSTLPDGSQGIVTKIMVMR